MSQLTATSPAEPERRIPSDAEYDFALGFVRILQRAAADPLYRTALLSVYEDDGNTDMIPLVEAAIAEILENAEEGVR